MRLEVLPVAVPPGPADADERHARLDQPARDQHLLAELRLAVAVADLLGLLRDVEELLARHDAADALVRLVMAAEAGRRAAALELLAEQVAQIGPLLMVEVADAVEPANELGRVARGKIHRRVAGAEESGVAR